MRKGLVHEVRHRVAAVPIQPVRRPVPGVVGQADHEVEDLVDDLAQVAGIGYR